MARVPADTASVVLFVEERHAWIHSQYGGLTCVALSGECAFTCSNQVVLAFIFLSIYAEAATPFPPIHLGGALLAQHPTTRQLATLAPDSARLELLRPLRESLLLCTLVADCGAVTAFCFLHECVVALEEARCSVFDVGTG